jgi:gliding motility-associated-like protein
MKLIFCLHKKIPNLKFGISIYYFKIVCFLSGPTETIFIGTSTSLANTVKLNVVFTTDPMYKTTVALPRFKTINTSSANQNPFVTNLKYDWGGGKSFKVGSDTVKSPSVIFGKDTGTYWIKLVVTTDKGCKDSLTQRVLIGPDIIIFVPDAFTPDNSGPNENNTFRPYIVDNKTFKMMVFNRWGENIFTTTEVGVGWDGTYQGKPVQDGIYTWVINFKSSLNNEIFEYTGYVNLLR